MEQWEKELRAKLEKETPDGLYQIGDKDFVFATGKDGYINFQVEMVRATRIPKQGAGLKQQMKKVQHHTYASLTDEKIEQVLNDIFYGRHNEDTTHSNSKRKGRKES